LLYIAIVLVCSNCFWFSRSSSKVAAELSEKAGAAAEALRTVENTKEENNNASDCAPTEYIKSRNLIAAAISFSLKLEYIQHRLER
jgi:hypothetical protein